MTLLWNRAQACTTEAEPETTDIHHDCWAAAVPVAVESYWYFNIFIHLVRQVRLVYVRIVTVKLKTKARILEGLLSSNQLII